MQNWDQMFILHDRNPICKGEKWTLSCNSVGGRCKDQRLGLSVWKKLQCVSSVCEWESLWLCTRCFRTPLPGISHCCAHSPRVAKGILMPRRYRSSITSGSGCCHSADSMSAAQLWVASWERNTHTRGTELESVRGIRLLDFTQRKKLFALSKVRLPLTGRFVISQDEDEEEGL